MKRQWTADELVEHWTVDPADLDLLANKTGATRLGYALLFTYFQAEGHFPKDKGAYRARRITRIEARSKAYTAPREIGRGRHDATAC